MKNLKDHVKEIQDRWDKIYPELDIGHWNNQSIGLRPEEVDDLLQTISKIYDRAQAPKNFSVIFDSAKASALSIIPNLKQEITNLESNNYNRVGQLINNINLLLGASVTILQSGVKDEEIVKQNINQNILSHESKIANTAKHIEDIWRNVVSVEEQVEQKKEKIKDIEDLTSELNEKLKNVSDTWDEVYQYNEEIKEYAKNSQNLYEKLSEHIEQNKKLLHEINQRNESINNQKSNLDDLQERIKNLLPESASATLAHAFENRAHKLKKPKIFWGIIFIIDMLAMITVALTIDFTSSEIWKSLLFKAPYWAPLVWLGWFSAVQYGNNMRLEEDYLFKATTAKAFIGYKDHMEQLRDIYGENEETALQNIAIQTINILATEPSRCFEKSTHEASPSQNISNLFPKKNNDS